MADNAPVQLNTTNSKLEYNKTGSAFEVPATASLSGGSTNQVLTKTSGSDYAYNWQTLSTGNLPTGGSSSQVLSKIDGTNFNCQWVTPSGGGSSYASIISVSGAVADCKFLTDAAIITSAATLTSASNPFISGDVGKSVVVKGAGAAGIALVTTISAYNNAGSVTLAATASTTVSSAVCHFGTNNTTAINNAISSLAKGGTVILDAGYYLVSSINLTGTNSKILRGSAMGINANDMGTVLVPLTVTNIVDMTGSGYVPLRDIQVGTTRSAQIPNVGLLCAQKSGGDVSSLLALSNVTINGSYNIAGLYVYGIGDSEARDLYVWNHIETNKSAAIFTRDNVASVTSEYQTIATGNHTCGNWTIDKFEFHETQSSGQSTGNSLRMRGVGQMTFKKGYIDSSSSLGQVLVESVDVPCGNHRYESCTFASEQSSAASYNINFSGDCSELSFDANCAFSNIASYFNGTGHVVSTKGIPLSFVMPEATSNGGTATIYIGTNSTGTTEFGVGALVMTRMLVQNFKVQANGNVSTGTHSFTVMKNGSATSIVGSLTGGGNTTIDATHSVVFEVGDRLAIRDVASGSADTRRFTIGLSGIPF